MIALHLGGWHLVHYAAIGVPALLVVLIFVLRRWG